MIMVVTCCFCAGVGPATASAVLAAASPSCPFMSDESLEAATGSREYTVPAYLSLLERLREKAEQLTQDTGVS